MGMFGWSKCNHEWEIKEGYTIESAFEQLRKNGVTFDNIKGDSKVLFQKTFVSIMTCKHCGAIHETIVRNPE